MKVLRSAFAAMALALVCAPADAIDIPTQSLGMGQALRGHFVQDRQLAGFAKPLRSEGSFVLVPGKGLIWRGEKPFANVIVISPEGITQIANGQVAMRLDASRIPGISHLYEVLGAAVSGNIEPLQQTFQVSQAPGTSPWKITLTPLHPDSPAMAQLKSLILSGGHFVENVQVDKGGGDVDRIAFKDTQASAANLSAEEKKLLGVGRK
jgi:hypothetical protein